MIRGIRGATTVLENDDEAIWRETKKCLEEMVQENNVNPNDVAHIWFTVTEDLNAAFPAKATRMLESEAWTYVPVMCATEIAVPNGLKRCIRIMMTVNTNVPASDIIHVFQNEAVQLRPDLAQND
ncbi:chorismate mutase [Bacillaceae bacterium JMAK1]|nr:chorismate mutase [Bacillaceae bacterium JMAK1]